MRKVYLLTCTLVLSLGIAGSALAISEETAPATCGNRLVAGVTCDGRYCDNLTPICGGAIHEIYDIRWTRLVSEEGDGVAACHVSNPFERGDFAGGEPAFITGFACNGDYCDNLALECVALRDAFPESLGGRSCRWTDWVSEETPSLRFPSGFGAIRMECDGRYCDNKRFFVCPVRAR